MPCRKTGHFLISPCSQRGIVKGVIKDSESSSLREDNDVHLLSERNFFESVDNHGRVVFTRDMTENLFIVWDAVVHMIHEVATIPGLVIVLVLFGLYTLKEN